MAITRTITVAAGVLAPGRAGELAQVVPSDLAGAVLAETGAVQRRLRALPSRAGLYFVLGLCLFPAAGYRGVRARLAARLGVRCPGLRALRDLRRRIGAGPVKALSELLAGPVAWPRAPGGVMSGRYRTAASGGGRPVRVPGTGRSRGWPGKMSAAPGEAGCPVIRLMTLCETGTRRWPARCPGPRRTAGSPGPASCCTCWARPCWC